MDAAFLQRDVFRLVAARGGGSAIKVGYWSWLPLKRLAAETRHWVPVAPDVTACETMLDVRQWNLRLRVVLYRRHVQHRSPRNLQLDLFTPEDGRFEYHAVATNLSLSLPALCAFIAGRGAQEKTIAELKGEFALDVVPTRTTRPTASGSNGEVEPRYTPVDVEGLDPQRPLGGGELLPGVSGLCPDAHSTHAAATTAPAG